MFCSVGGDIVVFFVGILVGYWLALWSLKRTTKKLQTGNDQVDAQLKRLQVRVELYDEKIAEVSRLKLKLLSEQQ